MKNDKKSNAVVNSSKIYNGKLFKRYWRLYVMLLPGTIYLLINNYMPISGLVLAFKQYNYEKGIWGSPWNGLKNFKYLFSTNDAFLMIRNTLGYNFAFIILGTIFAVIVAIILNEIKKSLPKKIYQIFILVPYLISMVVVSYIVYALLATDSGFINNTLGLKINWYMSPKYWPYILIIVNIWKSFGYNSIIYYATVIGIDSTLYEAAVVDGANRIQRIINITLPGLRPTIITLTLLAIGRVFYSDFGLFYQVPQNSGLLYDVTMTIDVYVYKGLILLNDIGRSAAAGFFQSICGFILILAANYAVSKMDKDNVLF